MENAAVTISRDLLERAKAAAAAIENAGSLKEIETSWSEFLTPANRIFSKLEQGAKRYPSSKAWFDQKKIERRGNAVLKYLQHARNVDEHGLAKVTEVTKPGLALGVGPGAWRFEGVFGPGGTLKVTALGGQIAGQSKFVEAIPSKVKLTAVTDRGVSYDPPKNESGSDMLPSEAAKSALTYLEAMIERAEKLANS